MASTLKVVCVVVMMMCLSIALSEAAVSCNQIQAQLAPCFAYLKNGGAPTRQCCANVGNLVNSAKTTPDRQAACNCLKAAAAKVTGINPTFAANLPKLCKVNIPYKISTSTNCASVK